MAEASWFAGRLRELREQSGLTQQQLAEKAGLTRAGVAQLEIGRRNPAWETVLAVAEALGVSCEAFTVPPADAERPGPGRPRKAADATQGGRSAGASTQGPSGQKKPAGGQGRKQKGKRPS